MAANDIDTGTVLGGYQVESILGKGGMGVVYKAHELSLNRKVALKVLSQRLSSDEEFITRFKREARVIAALEHPNIVRILSYGEEEGLYYYAMEYISGKDLGQVLKERSTIPLEEALDITAQVADALVEADVRGVVHRDLKPANIMIDEKGRVRITDFGIAFFEETGAGLTRTGFFLGTPEFASPEQAKGLPLDVRSDMYSLGTILYWILAGKPPFTGDSPQAVLIKIATEMLPPIQTVNPSVPEPVCALIEKMTAKNPADRFQKPDEILAAVGKCAAQLMPKDQPSASDSRQENIQNDKKATGQKKRNPALSDAVTLGVVLLLVLIIVLAIWQGKSIYQKMTSRDKPVQTQTAEAVKPIVRPTEASNQVDASASTPAQVESSQTAQRETLQAGSVAVQERAEAEPVAGHQDERSRPISEPVQGQTPSAPQDVASVNTQSGAGTAGAVPQSSQENSPVIRKIPYVLIITSGDETLVPMLRTNLAAIILKSRLKVVRIAEIPRLRERIQMGRVPITQYSISEIVPRKKADIILLARIQKTGTTMLQFYGQTQKMTTATFTVEAVDLASGEALEAQAMGTVEFTALNMVENFKEAVQESAGNIGDEIKQYWKDKRGLE